MPLEEKQSRFASDQVINKVLYPEADVEMTVNDQVVRAKTTPAGSAFTITLPSVVEARGRFYSVNMLARNGSKNITIEDKEDDSAISDITLNARYDRVLMYSDGFCWFTIEAVNI